MTEPENDGELTAERQDTASLLERLLGRAIADRYADFCRLASGALELRVSRPVAAHALRELESVLRDALKVPMEVKATENSVDPGWLVRAMQALQGIGFGDSAAARAVETLKPRTSHATQIAQITTRLGLAPDGDIAKAWIALTKTFGKAHERSFHHSLVVDDDFRRAFQQPFETVIRSVALALQRRYSALMQRVEEIAAMPDKAHAITLFEQEIPGAMPLQWHFFEKLETADWLPHLVRRDLIGPPLSGSTGAGAIRFREWPAGSYLQRMAESSNPEVRSLVAAAVRNVAASRHPDVCRGGMEIIATLPAAEAALLADVAAGWLDRDASFISLQAAEKLTKQLAEGGEGTAALNVATRLLQVFGDDGNVVSIYAQHMYEHSLPQLAPVLTSACGIGALQLLADLLHQAIVLSHKGSDDPAFDRTAYDQGPLSDDPSAIHDVDDALRSEVLRAAGSLVDADAGQMSGVIDVFSGYAPKLFRRLEVAVLSRNPSALPARSTALLLDAELIEASWCTHEYARLARAWFPSMSSDDRQTVLRLVDAIPGRYLDAWKARFEQHEKRPPTAEDVRVFSAHVIRDALWYWRTVLPAERQSAVDAIVAEFGDPDAWRHRYWAREEESPLTAAEFTARPVAEIAAFLRAWRSDEEPRLQTVTALALELRNAVTQDTAKYAQAAMEFADLPAIYVHRLLEGLGDAARNQRDFPWPQVLRLLDVTFSRWHQSVDPASIAEGNDPSWQWACVAGVELLKAGLQRGAAGIPFEHKAAVRSLILALQSRAPREPGLQDFEQRFERDPYLAAESTLRGSALELCVLLIFWLSKEEGSLLATTPRAALDMTQEVTAVFNAELADQTSNGRIPRAILARHLRRLFYYGEAWLTASMGSIFPESDEHLRRAAWLGHLLHDRGPLAEVLPFLRPHYARAIEQLSEEANDREAYGQKSLGNHLATLYLQGHLDLQPGGLLDRFLLKAPPRLRQHVMWWFGSNLKRLLEEFPESFRTRTLAYWESRLTAGEAASDREGFRGELGSIGHWCENHRLEPDWLFDRLLRMLRAGFVPSIAYNVVAWLGKISATHPDRAVEVLEALLTNRAIDHWAYVGQDQSIDTILTAGQERGTAKTIERVGEVVSFLASIGQTRYLDVVRPTQTAQGQG